MQFMKKTLKRVDRRSYQPSDVQLKQFSQE